MSRGLEARLFDADGQDREIDLEREDPGDIGARRLLWVDLDLDAGASLDSIADRVGLRPHERAHLESDVGRARLVHSADSIHLTLEAVEPEGEDGSALVRREIDLVARTGIVISVHRGDVAAIQRFLHGISGETSLGALRAADLLSSLADEVISGYHEVAEGIGIEIDRLDQVALEGRRGDEVLAEIVDLRRRIGMVRRTIAPHRAALSALGRPDLDEESGVGQPWPGLVDRLEGAMASVDALRDALIGTYDIHMARSAQRANDVMKILTVVSAVFLPAVVLAGVMGMNFQIPFFDEPGNYYVVVGAMAVFAVLVVVLVRWRRWI